MNIISKESSDFLKHLSEHQKIPAEKISEYFKGDAEKANSIIDSLVKSQYAYWSKTFSTELGTVETCEITEMGIGYLQYLDASEKAERRTVIVGIVSGIIGSVMGSVLSSLIMLWVSGS